MNKTKTFIEEEVRATKTFIEEEEVRAALRTAERIIIDSAEKAAKEGLVSELATKVGIELYRECAGVFRRATESLLNL